MVGEARTQDTTEEIISVSTGHWLLLLLEVFELYISFEQINYE